MTHETPLNVKSYGKGLKNYNRVLEEYYTVVIRVLGEYYTVVIIRKPQNPTSSPYNHSTPDSITIIVSLIDPP